MQNFIIIVKSFVRSFFVALAEGFRHERRSARAYHKTRSAENHDERINKVYRRELRFPDEVRDEIAVYNAVNRR